MPSTKGMWVRSRGGQSYQVFLFQCLRQRHRFSKGSPTEKLEAMRKQKCVWGVVTQRWSACSVFMWSESTPALQGITVSHTEKKLKLSVSLVSGENLHSFVTKWVFHYSCNFDDCSINCDPLKSKKHQQCSKNTLKVYSDFFVLTVCFRYFFLFFFFVYYRPTAFILWSLSSFIHIY